MVTFIVGLSRNSTADSHISSISEFHCVNQFEPKFSAHLLTTISIQAPSGMDMWRTSKTDEPLLGMT